MTTLRTFARTASGWRRAWAWRLMYSMSPAKPRSSQSRSVEAVGGSSWGNAGQLEAQGLGLLFQACFQRLHAVMITLAGKWRR